MFIQISDRNGEDARERRGGRRHTPPISRLWMGVPETAMAEETAAVTMVVNFILNRI